MILFFPVRQLSDQENDSGLAFVSSIHLSSRTFFLWMPSCDKCWSARHRLHHVRLRTAFSSMSQLSMKMTSRTSSSVNLASSSRLLAIKSVCTQGFPPSIVFQRHQTRHLLLKFHHIFWHIEQIVDKVLLACEIYFLKFHIPHASTRHRCVNLSAFIMETNSLFKAYLTFEYKANRMGLRWHRNIMNIALQNLLTETVALGFLPLGVTGAFVTWRSWDVRLPMVTIALASSV